VPPPTLSPSLAKCAKYGLLLSPPPSRAKVSRGGFSAHFDAVTTSSTSLACNGELEVGFIRCFNAVSATSPACDSQPEVVFIWRFDTVHAITTTSVDDVSMPMTCHITQRGNNQSLPQQYHHHHQRKCAQRPRRVVPKLINASQVRTPVSHHVANPILCAAALSTLSIRQNRQTTHPNLAILHGCVN